MMPTSFVDNQLAGSMSNIADFDARKAELYAYYGLEEHPTFMGVVKGYLGWLGKFVTGDFGVSFKYGRPVEEVIFENMGISFTISFISLISNGSV
jgi:ABC-type dipeptide/oligopeptide/nickel transport system permease component